ncbi:hypothetical protein C1T31_05205 [Hanstruepera neustonica]|uniref:Glycosyltransferase RgtA/B/C/D-like domain-containing protein n=1 Tax=Hanstruepera neustonica TaxID=1445657 RepID=A0A2K1E0D2_9FLAO|nr:hypothetical protein [Hanstruepera neustonica]PNQ73733.1 hypothetical protein C1T31_05205 [Hanstruepera neustonica]
MRVIHNFFKDKNLLYLLIIGLGIRLLLFLIVYPSESAFPDSGSYFRLAKKLSTLSLEGYDGKRSPGYPLLILFAAGKVKIAVIYQFIMGTIASLFWYKTLINLKFSRRHSFYVVLFLQSFLNVFFYETSILLESLTLFCTSFIVYFITSPSYRNSNTIKTELILGAVLGYLVLIKPFFAYWPFLIYGLYTLKDFNLNRIINKKLILLIFPLLVYFGWSYVNKLNTGYFVSTTFLGLNMSQNCVYFAEKAPEEYQWIGQPYAQYRNKTIAENRDVAMSIWNAYGEGRVFDKYNLSFEELSHELGEFAKATVAANPKDYLKQVFFRSGLDFWKPALDWNEDNFRFHSAFQVFDNIWRVQKIILYAIVIAFIGISIMVFYRSIVNRQVDITFILVSFVMVPALLQAMVTYGTNDRYSYPFDFMMFFVVLLFVRQNNIIHKVKSFFR